jgi:hypothetical protein
VAGVGRPLYPAAARQRRYPNLERAVSSGADMDNDAAFEFILEFILDAVAAQLPERRR